MITGTGVDIVEIPRIRKAVETWGDKFLNKIFTSEEIAYAKKHEVPYPHYAGRFAAKEAVYKALGDKKITWQDLTIVNDSDGKPLCRLKGKRLQGKIHLSISHSKYYAVASAIVEKE
ncbi:MAG: holo-ACP synthase [Candidatus Omnitrophica bacterium]|nr:holo-ACP synthase [Candidatus Omnitrophota bacterium]